LKVGGRKDKFETKSGKGKKVPLRRLQSALVRKKQRFLQERPKKDSRKRKREKPSAADPRQKKGTLGRNEHCGKKKNTGQHSELKRRKRVLSNVGATLVPESGMTPSRAAKTRHGRKKKGRRDPQNYEKKKNDNTSEPPGNGSPGGRAEKKKRKKHNSGPAGNR